MVMIILPRDHGGHQEAINQLQCRLLQYTEAIAPRITYRDIDDKETTTRANQRLVKALIDGREVLTNALMNTATYNAGGDLVGREITALQAMFTALSTKPRLEAVNTIEMYGMDAIKTPVHFEINAQKAEKIRAELLKRYRAIVDAIEPADSGAAAKAEIERLKTRLTTQIELK